MGAAGGGMVAVEGSGAMAGASRGVEAALEAMRQHRDSSCRLASTPKCFC